MVQRRSVDDFSPPPAREIIRWTTVGIVALIVVAVAWNSFYTVAANEQAVVLRFGQYHATAGPGAHFQIPFVDEVLKVRVAERQLRLPGRTGSENVTSESLPEEESLMLTGDLNAASVEWTIQWRVNKPKEFLFAFYDPEDEHVFERVFRTAARSVMNRLIGDYSVDEVLTSKRNEIAEQALESTQEILNAYNCGVLITDLQMQRVTPPERVKPAFDAVNASIQERDRLENEAIKERNKLLPAARAHKDKLIQEAKGYADRATATVTGEIAALRAKYEAYQLAPRETRRRLYLETMQTVLQNVDQKTILDAELNHTLPLLRLDQPQGTSPRSTPQSVSDPSPSNSYLNPSRSYITPKR